MNTCDERSKSVLDRTAGSPSCLPLAGLQPALPSASQQMFQVTGWYWCTSELQKNHRAQLLKEHPHPHTQRRAHGRVRWQSISLLPPFLGGHLTYLQLLQVWSLHADHSSQQLILQAIPGHGEVDQGGLSLQLGLVVRVGQLGVKDKPEPGVILTLFVSNFNEPGTKRLMLRWVPSWELGSGTESCMGFFARS